MRYIKSYKMFEDIETSLENDRFNPIISDITLDIKDQGFKVEPVYGFDPGENEHYLLVHIHMAAANGYKFNLVDIKPTIMELASQLKGSGAYFNRMETTCTSIVQTGPSDKEFKTNAYMSDEIGPGDTNNDISNMLDKHISDVGDRKCEYVQLFFIF